MPASCAISAIRAVSSMFWSSGLREPSNISEVKPLSSASRHSSKV
jgi:hypothetical protein